MLYRIPFLVRVILFNLWIIAYAIAATEHEQRISDNIIPATRNSLSRSTAWADIQDRLIIQVIRVVSERSYDEGINNPETHIVPIVDEKRESKASFNSQNKLPPKWWDFNFNDNGRNLRAYRNYYCTDGEIRGYIYSITEEGFDNDSIQSLRDKIFIGFPGTERGFQWFQNIFRVGNLNGQLSYDENIRTLFNEKGDLGFIEAINKHIKFRKSQGYTINNDFYFIGHSRGGGLSLVAARKFREEIQRGLFREFLQDGDVRIKIVTFCAPKVYSFLPMHHQCIKEFGFENIVHFSNKAIPIPFPSISLFEVEDPAPQFPFYWPKNLGINVPVTVIGMPHVVHNIPSTTDINSAIRLYNSPSEHSLYFIPSLFKGSCWFLLGALYAHGSELTRINSLRHVLNLFEFSGDIAKNLTISFLKLFSYKLPESFKDLLDRRGLG